MSHVPVHIDENKGLPELPDVTEEQRRLYLSYLETSGRKRNSAMLAGVDPARIQWLVKKDDEFAALEAAAMEGYKELIHASIHDRAINGVERGVYYQGERIAVERHFSDTLLLALAKAYDPRFRDHVQVDANVKAGVLVVQASLDPDDWEKEYAGARVDTSRIDNICQEQDASGEQDDGGGGVQ